MSRAAERLIDAWVLMMLFMFSYFIRIDHPGLAGVIIMAALMFWMNKNTTYTATIIEDKAAAAAANVLQVAREQVELSKEAEDRHQTVRAQERQDLKNIAEPQPVEIVGQQEVVKVNVVDKDKE